MIGDFRGQGKHTLTPPQQQQTSINNLRRRPNKWPTLEQRCNQSNGNVGQRGYGIRTTTPNEPKQCDLPSQASPVRGEATGLTFDSLGQCVASYGFLFLTEGCKECLESELMCCMHRSSRRVARLISACNSTTTARVRPSTECSPRDCGHQKSSSSRSSLPHCPAFRHKPSRRPECRTNPQRAEKTRQTQTA